MKIFLYWLGTMAEVGIAMIFVFLIWFLTRMDAWEIIVVAVMATMMIIIPVFNGIDEIILKLEEENNEQGEQQSQNNGDNTDAVRVQP